MFQHIAADLLSAKWQKEKGKESAKARKNAQK
jgi:hypothetical protein